MAVEYGRWSFAIVQPFAIQIEYPMARYAAFSNVVSGSSHGRTNPLRIVALNTYQITSPVAMARAVSHLCSMICDVEYAPTAITACFQYQRDEPRRAYSSMR